MIGKNVCRWILLALIALQPLWFLWLAPPLLLEPLAAVVIMAGPLIVALPFAWQLGKRALVITGCILLVHFCLAVSEAWVSPQARVPAVAQAILVALYFTALSSIRFGRRPAQSESRPSEDSRSKP